MVSFYKGPAKPKRSGKKSPARAVSSTEVTIDALDWQGQGVARGNPVTFVEGALVGERVRVTVTSQQKQVAHGHVSSVIDASPSRQKPFCEIYDQCGGCQMQHVDADEALTLRQQALSTMWHRQLGLETLPWFAPVTAERPAYRRKARLAVDARSPKKLLVGFREQGSKKVTNVEHCPVLTPRLDALLPPVHALLQTQDGARNVGHISLMDGENTAEVIFRITRDISREMQDALTQLGKENGCNVGLETAPGECTMLHAEEALYISPENGIHLAPGPNDFIQVNNGVNKAMVAQAMDWLLPEKGETVADLFCGLGNFSLPLAARGTHVIAAEGVEEMVTKAAAQANAQGFNNIEWHTADLTQPSQIAPLLGDAVTKVLIDPSREGAQAVCDYIGSHPTVKTLLYVSCNPSTFARDLKPLLAGGFEIAKLSLLEMFPYTRHLEVMALLRRKEQ